jgi:FixJ family two-component response regulator
MMSAKSGPCVFVVDDDPSVLKALQRMLAAAGMRVAAFDSASAFLDAYDEDVEGCLVLDVKMPGMSGLELQDVLAAHGCTLPIVFLTGHGDIRMSVRAMQHGAADFLTKPADMDILTAAISKALESSRRAREERVARGAIEQRLRLLTAREREVLAHLIGGKLNKQVAASLGTVEKTIKVHRSRVMRKMQVRSVAELVRLCEQVGIKPAP